MATRTARQKARLRRAARLEKLALRSHERSVLVTDGSSTRGTDNPPVAAQDAVGSHPETTDEHPGGGHQPPAQIRNNEGVRGLLADPHHLRSDLIMLRKYMGVGCLKESEIEWMVKRMRNIVLKSDDRNSIQALRTLLAQAKLSYDMEHGRKASGGVSGGLHKHGHVHLHGERPANGIGTDFLEIAAELGIPITASEVDRVEDAPEWEDREPRRPQQEID